MRDEVKTQVDTQDISISTAAAEAVQKIINEKNIEGYALRVYVSGGGCCGSQFGMALDDNIREVDTTYEAGGIRLVVDEVSLDYLRGASIDYIDDPERGAGFIVNNPNQVAHNHAGDACACGGSCACDH